MAEKLKECPFCGDEEIRVIRVGTPAASCIVGCTNCGAELESNEIGSGYYWNDRPQIKEENSNSAEKTQPSGETNNRSDVICEWKFDDDSGCFDTNCGHNIQDEETTSTWVCCPHCSRKIRTCG